LGDYPFAVGERQGKFMLPLDGSGTVILPNNFQII
jgi:hypothetical protein